MTPTPGALILSRPSPQALSSSPLGGHSCSGAFIGPGDARCKSSLPNLRLRHPNFFLRAAAAELLVHPHQRSTLSVFLDSSSLRPEYETFVRDTFGISWTVSCVPLCALASLHS